MCKGVKCQPTVKFVGTYKNTVRSQNKFINVVGFFNGVMQSCQPYEQAYTFPSSLFDSYSLNQRTKEGLLQGASGDERDLSNQLLSELPSDIHTFFIVRQTALMNINPNRITLPMQNIVPLLRQLRNQRQEINIRQYTDEDTCLMRVSNNEIMIGRLNGNFFSAYLLYLPFYKNGYVYMYTVNASLNSNERYFIYNANNPIFQRIFDFVPSVPFPLGSEEFTEEEDRIVTEMENEANQEHAINLRERQTAEANRLGNPNYQLTDAEREQIQNERKRQFDKMAKVQETQNKIQKTEKQEEKQYDVCILCGDFLDNVHGPDENNECSNSCRAGNSNCQPSCNNDVVVVCNNLDKFHRQCIINSCNRGPVDMSAQMGYMEYAGSNIVEQKNKDKCPVCLTPLLYPCNEFYSIPRVPTEKLLPEKGGSRNRRTTCKRKLSKNRRKSKKKY